MMSRHFGLSSELTGAIAKRLPHAKNQLSAPGSFFNQFVTEIYIYTNINRVLIVRIYIQALFTSLHSAACGHFFYTESPCGRLDLLNLTYKCFGNLFTLYKSVVLNQFSLATPLYNF